MPERNSKPLKVLIRQLKKNVDLNALFGKALGVLGHAEFFEPVRNLLHGGHQRSRRGMTEFSITATESLHQYVPDGTTSYAAIFAVVSRRFQGSLGISILVDP